MLNVVCELAKVTTSSYQRPSLYEAVVAVVETPLEVAINWPLAFMVTLRYTEPITPEAVEPRTTRVWLAWVVENQRTTEEDAAVIDAVEVRPAASTPRTAVWI